MALLQIVQTQHALSVPPLFQNANCASTLQFAQSASQDTMLVEVPAKSVLVDVVFAKVAVAVPSA